MLEWHDRERVAELGFFIILN